MKTKRTTLKRLPKRGVYDRDVINAILDEAFFCHVGFVVDGQPYVIPTGFARIGDDLMLHGSATCRIMCKNMLEVNGRQEYNTHL